MSKDLHLIPQFRDKLSYVYVEHAVVERDQQSLAYYNAQGKTQIPVASIALLMLGPGTNVSHAAMDIIARNNCLVSWCGEECVRTYAFGTGGTHSSARLLRQAQLVSDPVQRTAVVRSLYQKRFDDPVSPEHSIEQLRGKEGIRVRNAYQRLAQQFDIEWEGRRYDRGAWAKADPPNRALSAANACLYGICHAAIISMGYSPALGFIHTGKQFSFVYDLADLYKLEIAVPVAFEQAAEGLTDLERRVRHQMRDKFRDSRLLDRIVDDLNDLFGPDPEDIEVYDDDPALPGELWGDD